MFFIENACSISSFVYRVDNTLFVTKVFIVFNLVFLCDIETNIKIGIAYLSHLKKKFNNYELVAAGYNGGTGGAIRYKEYLFGKRKQNEIPGQTLAYVPKVMGYTLDFKKNTKI